MAFARVNGIVIHYELRGPAERPVIVFSNSLGTDLRIWDGVAELLEPRYRLLRYDKRGHGLSETGPTPYRMSDHVGDLAALLDHLGIARAAIVGLSVGGMIAQGLGALRPDLAAALVLSNTAHKIGTEEMWNARIETVRKGGIAALADATLERWFTPGFRTPDNPVFVGASTMLRRAVVEGYLATSEAIRDADLTGTTRALNLPVLCIAGDHDGSTPPDLVRSLADLIGGSEFHIIEGTGHIPCVEKPEVYAGLITDFLGRAGHA